ncbi:MAG: FAD/FMN-containing dehydrogenase [Candidatus Saccharimonadales bacterium]|jgi:FAD/FMN-containing dehydrogenase
MNQDILNRLKENYRADISTDDVSREAASTDASIFQVMPQAVTAPVDVEDLMTLVRNANGVKDNGQEVSLSVRAGGTCMSGGSLSEGIIVDLKPGFNWVGEFDLKECSVWVGSGTYHRDLEKAASEHGLLFAPYTSSKDICVIGGMVGNNASGEKSIRYGATVDNVMAVRMVCSDGNEYEFSSIDQQTFREKLTLEGFEGDIYRQLNDLVEQNWDTIRSARPKVKKNAAGYGIWRLWNKDKSDFNIAKLIVGAQGTLGFVTSAKLRLIEKLNHKRMIVIPIKDLAHLALGVQTVMANNPEGLETYDHHTYELAKQYLPEEAQLAKIAEGEHMVLMAQFVEHTKDQTDHYAEVCKQALERKGYSVHLVDDPAEVEAHWAIRRASFKLLMEHPQPNTAAVPFLEDTIVSIEHYGEFLSALEAILSDYEMIYTYAGHIGDGSIRLIPLINMEADDAADKVFELMRRTADLVFAFGGSMSADHNDGLIRSPLLPRMYGPEVTQLFKQTKAIFDSRNLFNPGKKVGASLAYSKQHMKRTNEAPKAVPKVITVK